jgi:hypothetical protein
MISTLLNLTCTMIVQGRELRLSVEREDADVWRWKIAYDEGQVLDKGFTTTRLAAQVTAQHAFERRVLRAGVNNWKFTGYRWTEVVC